ncbi:3'-5' exonuclease [Roseateles koreensis]|uniref:3'-5' exonuclease n=1 Tax=Roseateles koreensis TaxID=2987526 RepID=A0ABT5KU99_9BURK|nr:3'-5' exonuclease [Roseateles koreensis]MDC8786525.1 3'-5' exonuclease [Roseateles koreensis]
MQTIAVIDFETSGLAPGGGGRATEIAAVLVRDGRIEGSFSSLMKTGVWVPPFIEQLTGISNEMLEQAPAAEEVMRQMAVFTQGCAMVAHNAPFDRGFWHAEMALAGCDPDPAHEFACTVLLARRLYPEAPSCKLGMLAQFHHLPDSGRAHRALADAMTTAHLLLRIQQDVAAQFADELEDWPVDHALLAHLQRANKSALKRSVQDFVRKMKLSEGATSANRGFARASAEAGV